MSGSNTPSISDNHWIVPLRDNSTKPNRNHDDKRTELCEFCGVYFDPSRTTLKMVHHRIRSVCFRCLDDIERQERGEDLTK